MKKLLFVLSCFLAAITMMATETKVDFTVDAAQKAGFPTSASTTVSTATYSGVTFECYNAYISPSKYLMVGKKNAYITFTAPQLTKQLIITNTSGCSKNVNVSIYAGTTLIGSDTNFGTQSGTYTWNIPEEFQAKDTKFKLLITTKYNCQIESITFSDGEGGTVEPEPEPEPWNPTPGIYTYAVSVNDATNVQGTDIPERPAGTNSSDDNGEAHHVQPLTGLDLGFISLAPAKNTGSTEPALYYPFSSTPNANIRIYSGNTLTVTVPELARLRTLKFTGTNAANLDKLTVSTGKTHAEKANATSFEWAADAEGIGTSGPVTFTFAGNFRITKIEATYDADPATIIAEPGVVRNLTLFTGQATTFTAEILAENLLQPITIECPEDITTSESTISVADATEGKTITFTITPTAADYDYTRTIKLVSGTTEATININGAVLSLVNVPSADKISGIISAADYDEYGTYFIYKGEAVVTGFNYNSSGYAQFYLQDETGGMLVDCTYPENRVAPVALGDKVTNLTFMLMDENAKSPVLWLMKMMNENGFEVVSKDNTVEPLAVTLDQYTADFAAKNIYRLVKVEGVKFTDAADKTFGPGMNIYFAQGEKTAPARVASGSNLIGQPLPTGKANLTGISYSAAQLTLYLRNSADVVEVATPTITSTEEEFSFDVAVDNMPLTFTTTISGTDLEGDITITCPSDITSSVATVTAAEAAEGKEVTFTVTPAADDAYDHVITLSTPGGDDLELHVSGWVIEVTRVANSTQLMAMAEDDDAGYYMYTGKAIVTGINVLNPDSPSAREVVVYAQDMFGGMKLSSLYNSTYDESDLQIGDELTDICFVFGEINPNAPVAYFCSFTGEGTGYTKTGENKPKSPVEVSLADFTAAGAPNYLYRLVTVKDVTFTEENDGTFITTNMYVTDGEKTAAVRVMTTATDLLGTELPSTSVTLTGISDSHAQLTLLLRNSQDVVAGAPSLEVASVENLIDFNSAAAPIGEDTEIAVVTVKAANLTQSLPILFGGANAEFFSANYEAIPAGTGTYEVKVIYHPTATGRHTGSFTIDADAVNPEFNFARQISAKAYDPDNMPAISIEPATVELYTTPGKPVTAEVVLNATGCFDYIQGARTGTGANGGITINNTYLLPDSKDVKLTVTFNPTEEGEFSETFVYTSTLCATPATLTVNAYCDGEREEEELQGDLFELDEQNALYTYSHDFYGHEHNKPLSVEAWTNVAMQGTRAWWGYQSADEADAFHAAKATAYDSTLRPALAQDCQMMLISPALNYADAADKHIEFKLMGMYLTEGQSTKLEIMLGVPNGTSQPDFYAMDGFSIPATSDEAGTWVPYQVDMSAVEDMPDTFFIGFRLTGKRSSAEPATYYVRDFVWNASGESLSVDSLLDGSQLYTVFNMQGICVLSGADAPTVKALPAGLYIVNGKKVYLK